MDPKSPPSRFLTLGPVHLENADGRPARSLLAQPKRVALLAYLRLARNGDPVPRHDVLNTFWPESPEDRALSSLRQSLHFLRRSLGSHAVERTGDHLLEVPAEAVWCDAAEFVHLIGEGRAAEAIERYRGPFLEGLELDDSRELEDWVDGTRRRFRDLAVTALAMLSEDARAEGRTAEALERAKKLVELDPLDERGASLLLEAHASAGDPVAARRAYDDYAALLGRELGVGPSAGLARRVAALGGQAAPAEPEPAGTAAGPRLPTRDGPSRVSTLRDRKDSATGEAPSPGAPTRAPARPRLSRPLLAGLAIVAAALVVWGLTGRGGVGDGEAPDWVVDPSVAVLPFRSLSPDSSNAFFAAGVHESLLVTLSRIGAIRVASLRAVERYAGADVSLSQIARELAVTSVLRGSVQREGDRIRIIVELSDPSTGAQIWAQEYDRRLHDVFGVQTDIARSVAASLEAVLTPGEEDRIARRPTDDVEALDLYMRAHQAYSEGQLEGVNEAIGLFESAIDRDPGFAQAWAGLADALLQRVQFFGYPLTWADSARILAEHALRLDPELPEGHKTIGFVHSVHGRERAALDAIGRALSFRPGYADPLNNAGWSLYYLGEVAEAERMIGASFRLQPNVPLIRSNMGAIWAALGRVEEAAEWLDALLDVEPRLTAARTWRVFAEYQAGDPDGALELAERYLADESTPAAAYARAAYAALLARHPDRAAEYGGRAAREAPGVDVFDMRRIETIRAAALVALGREAEGYRLAREAIEATNRRVANGADGWDPPVEWAAAHAVIGDTDEALRHLERAVDIGFPHSRLLGLDPAFDRLRNDPRFAALLERVEAHETAEREQSFLR